MRFVVPCSPLQQLPLVFLKKEGRPRTGCPHTYCNTNIESDFYIDHCVPDVTRVHRRLTLRMRAKRTCEEFVLRPLTFDPRWREKTSAVSVTSSHLSRGKGIVAAMSLQRRTGEVFQLLEVEQLPEEWVGRCWDENFCESTPLPPQVLLLASVASTSIACHKHLAT